MERMPSGAPAGLVLSSLLPLQAEQALKRKENSEKGFPSLLRGRQALGLIEYAF